MNARLLFAGGLVALAVGVACSAFGSDDPSSADEPDAATDGAATGDAGDAATDGSLAACTKLSPGVGPPPLHPDGGTTSCGGNMVDLSVSKANCGTCGRSCNGMNCVGGACATESLYVGPTDEGLQYTRRGRFVVASAIEAVDMFPDGGDVRPIAANDGGACCGSVALDPDGADWFFHQRAFAERIGPDGKPSTIVSLAVTDSLAFAVTPLDIAFAQASGGGGPTYGIRAISKSDAMFHDIAPTEPFATALIRDGHFLMWAQEPILTPGAGTAGLIARLDLTSDDLRKSGTVAVSGGIGFDASFIYYFDGVTKELRRLPKNKDLMGAPGETLATWKGPENSASAISAFGDYVYFSLSTGGSLSGGVIARVHRCGGEPMVVARDSANSIRGVSIVESGKLYFVSGRSLLRTEP